MTSPAPGETASHKISPRPFSRRAVPRRTPCPWLLCLILLGGCGAPGEPQPPAPPIPAAITDLAAHQSGDGVTLVFTPPRRTVSGERLAEIPAVEILRGTPSSGGAADEKSFRVVYTIPGSLVETYLVDDRAQFFDPVPPPQAQAGHAFFYRVRTRASRKKASPDSSSVSVRLFPVAAAIPKVEATVTDPAIELSWAAPDRTSSGDKLPSVPGYHIYRGELDTATASAAEHDLSAAKWLSPMALLAPSPTNHFRDTQFTFGHTYLYVVRTLVLGGGEAIESADSLPVVVTPRDVFPPPPPQALVAVLVPIPDPPSLQVDLSWSLSLETDLAGHRVYRSEKEGTRGELLTPELLSAPAFRDISVVSGHLYWYSVTAVDRSGNESPASVASVDVKQP